MPIALAVFAVFIAVGSVSAVIFPSQVLTLATEFVAEPGGIWWAAAIRLVLAVLLWFSAPVSRTPATFKVMAGIVLIAAIIIPIMGSERMLMLLAWFDSKPLWVVRVPSVLGVALGAFILWSVSRKWSKKQEQ